MKNDSLYIQLIVWIWFKATKLMIKNGSGRTWMTNWIDAAFDHEIYKKLTKTS